MNLFPLYRDAGGNDYYISGRQFAYPFAETTYSLKSMRDEDGKLHYSHLIGDAQSTAFEQVLADASTTQSKDYADYTGNKEFAKLVDGVDYRVFINNMETDIVFPSDYKTIGIVGKLKDYNLADVDLSDIYNPLIYLNTGAGIRVVSFTLVENSDRSCEWLVNCAEEGTSVTMKDTELGVLGGELYFSLEAIQRVLGYHIDVYPDAINIVTDVKDLVDKDSGIPSQAPDLPIPEPEDIPEGND